MLKLLFFAISAFALPVVINKSTDGRGFDWIRPYLRQIWTGIAAFYSLYLLCEPGPVEVSMKLHKYLAGTPAIGYLASAVVGASLLCGYWWFTGKEFSGRTRPAETGSAPTKNEPEPTYFPKPVPVGAQDFSDAVVIKAKHYPDIEAAISGSIAELFLVNGTAAPVKVSVRIITDANRFDQKTLASRPMPPPTIDLGQIAVSGRKGLTKVELADEDEEAVLVSADFGASPDFTRPLSYRIYFRKPAQTWLYEYTLHDNYERRKLLQRGGTPENAADKRRRVRFKLSQLIMHGNMLKQGFTWLCEPSVDEKTRQPVDPTDKLGKMMLEIQTWGAEATFWIQWELGDSYVARLTTPAQSTQYPRGFEQLRHADFYRDSWDRLTTYLSKLEEFLKELPEL